MEKFSILIAKTPKGFKVVGDIDSDVDGKLAELKRITDAQGLISSGKTSVQASEAVVIHSTKGTLKTRKF